MSKNVGGLYVELSSDNKKFNQGINESMDKLKEAQDTINNINDASMDGLKSDLSGVNEELRSIKVSSQIVKQDLLEFKESLKGMSDSQIDELFERTGSKANELAQFIEKAKQKQMEATESWRWDNVINKSEYALSRYNEKLRELEKVMQELPTEKMDEMTDGINQSQKGLKGLIAKLKNEWKEAYEEAKKEVMETANEMENTADKIKKTDNNTKDFGKNISKNFKKGINSLKRFALALIGIRTGFSYLITNMRAYINSSDELKAKTEGIGQALQQALAPYAEIAVAALQKVVHWVILAIGYFTTFINTIFGTKIAIGGMTKNMKNLTAGTKAAGKAAEKALAPFDELNILQENNDSGGGAGGVAPDFTGLGLDDADMSGLDAFADRLNSLKSMAIDVFNNVKQKIIDAWDSQPVQAFVGYANAFGNFLLQYWTAMGVNLYNNILMTWNNIRDNVSLIWTNLTELWTMFWTDMTAFVEEWGPKLIEDITGVFNSIWKDAIDPAIQTAVQIFTDFTGILKDTWAKNGKDLLDAIGEALQKTVQLFQKLWDDIIKPIIEPFLEQLRWLWDTKLKKIVENFTAFVQELITLALRIYNKVIAPLISWIADKLAPIWSGAWSTILGVTSSIIGTIINIANGIITTLRGIIDFITGAFTLNWGKAWEGVKGVFTGIFESITGVAKGVINVLIDVINGFIKAINLIHFDVPDWVPVIGGKKWGFDIQPLQKLATGTVATESQVVNIAEYTGAKTNPEIVSPRDMMYDTMVKALKETGQNTGTTNDMTLTLNVKYEDGRTIIRKINAAQDEAGRTLLEV